MSDKITAYKGFNADLTCREFQFEIGASYEHEGKVEVCESGFHACEHPLDVFNYYPPATSRFALVELSGETDRDGNGDTKVAAAKIAALCIKRTKTLHDFSGLMYQTHQGCDR